MKNHDNTQDLAAMVCSIDRLQTMEHSLSHIAWSRDYMLGSLAAEITPSRLDGYISQHLQFLADFSTARYKWTKQQLSTMAWLIRKQHPSLTFPLFQLFIVQCMAGKYGKFYDKLDAVELLSWLQKFLADLDAWRRYNWDTRPQN